jgi:hypothetical protein
MPHTAIRRGCTPAHPSARPRRSPFASPHSATNTIAASTQSGGRCVRAAQAIAASRSPESKSDAHTFVSPAPRHRAITAHQHPTPPPHIPHPHKRHSRYHTKHPQPSAAPPNTWRTSYPCLCVCNPYTSTLSSHPHRTDPPQPLRCLHAFHPSARPARTVIRPYRSPAAAAQL